jgi:cyanate permease
MLTDLRNWLVVAGCVVIGIFGLFYAAHSHASDQYLMGLGAFFAALAIIIVLVRRALDDADANHK